jgi:hypothetical protein
LYSVFLISLLALKLLARQLTVARPYSSLDMQQRNTEQTQSLSHLLNNSLYYWLQPPVESSMLYGQVPETACFFSGFVKHISGHQMTLSERMRVKRTPIALPAVKSCCTHSYHRDRGTYKDSTIRSTTVTFFSSFILFKPEFLFRIR